MTTSLTVATLADLDVGSRGTIRAFHCAVPLMQRLLEMGLTRGTTVEVVRLAPLGDPMQIRLRGYYLSLRKAVASLIEVETEARP
jgi:ferrous iron transport protein A